MRLVEPTDRPIEMMPIARSRSTPLDEVVLGALDPDAAASTTQFVRFSSPYERVDIAARPTTFAHTVAREVKTRRFELIELEAVFAGEPPEEEVAWRTDSWSWLAISLAAGAVAVAAMWIA